MKDIVIPLDFSEISLNAARYATAMLSGKQDIRIILYHMYADAEEAATAARYLDNLKAEMISNGVTSNIEIINESGDDLIESLGRVAHQKSAELVIMGVTEKEEWKLLFSRSNSLRMAEENVCPVMIIPSGVGYNEIKNIALASDFRDVEASTPALAIKNVLELFNANMHIVNISNEHYVSLTEEFVEERRKMKEMFAEYKPEFYFIGMNDFFEGIDQFNRDHAIDLLIMIPKYRSVFDSFFSPGHTQKLAFSSNIPILAAHE